MRVDGITATRDRSAFFIQGSLLVEVIACAVQVGDTLSDDGTLCIAPRSVPNAVTRIHGGGISACCRAQVSMPCVIACADRLCEILAKLVSAGESAEVGSLAASCTRDEERHS